MTGAWRPALGRVAARALDVLYPRVCAGCRDPLRSGGPVLFCAACAADLPWITPPFCARCGEPFTVMAPEDADRFAGRVCAGCRADPPAYDAARAAFRFEGPARNAIHSFKFRARREAARELAALLYRRLAEEEGYLAGVNAVLPMPLHPRRRRERGYNQAELLARPFAELAGLPYDQRLLLRSRETASQVGLDRAARRANVRDAFGAADPALVAGRSFLILDDVMTTGATMAAAAAALHANGAAAVRAGALARG